VASGVIDEPQDLPKEPSSPACLAHEADDAYMGFATKAEIAAFLKALAEAEQADRPHAELLRKILSRVRDDALYRELSAKLKGARVCQIRHLGSGKDSWVRWRNFFWPGSF
jgi:hypothetical protein